MKKSSDAIAWLRNNHLRLLQKYWMWILLTVVLIVMAFEVKVWIEIGFDWLRTTWSASSKLDLHEQIDIKLKIIGGLLSGVLIFVGLVIAIWRSMIAARQASSMERQVSNMERQVSNMESQVSSMETGQYSDRFAKAVEQIANNQLAIRLGGLASIEALSKETEDEFIRVWKYLGHFLRDPPELAQWRNEQKKFGKRPDVAAVAAMLHDGRNKTHLRWIEGNQLPLRYANLQSADLEDANLQDANLEGANLQGAGLFRAKLQDANLQDANLQGARLFNAKLQGARLFYTKLQDAYLQNAYLQGARLFHANLQDANLEGVNLQGADLFNANLQGANLQDADLQDADLQDAKLPGANLQDADLRKASLQERELQQLFSKDDGVLLKGALFSLAALKEALHIKSLMPEKISEVYYDASDGPLPDDWPGDYKPQPITYTEWLEKRK